MADTGAGHTRHPRESDLALRSRVALSGMWRGLRANGGILLSSAVVGAVLLIAIAAPLIAPHDPTQPVTTGQFLPLWSDQAPLGTDAFGRDQLSRLIHGARPVVVASVGSVIVALVVGGLIGLVAGGAGGRTDGILMRCIDVLMSLPPVLLAIVVVAGLGSNLFNLVMAIAVAQVPVFARLARLTTVSERTRDYVMAARALGMRRWRILFSEILPNIAPTLFVQATSQLATAALTATGLAYLGLGTTPPTPDWGVMVREAQEYLFIAPEQAILPGLCIVIFITACNFLGDGLLAVTEGNG